jgi:rhodanese-related sulfurtransferase
MRLLRQMRAILPYGCDSADSRIILNSIYRKAVSSMKKITALAAVLLLSVLLTSCATGANQASPETQTSPAIQTTPADQAGPAVQTTPAEQSAPAVEAEYHKITAEQAKERIDSGDDLIILDVRTQEEYDAGHVEGALLLPNETISDVRPDLLPDLDQEILIYCRSGNRSAQAANKLVDMGYTAVYDFGGVVDWPYGTVTD